MPYELSWKTDRYLQTRYFGAVTLEECREATLAPAGDPRIVNARYVLSDWSGVTGVTYGDQDLKEFASLVRVYEHSMPHVRIALVPGDYEHSVEYGNAFLLLMEEHKFDVYMASDIKDAEDWLFQET